MTKQRYEELRTSHRCVCCTKQDERTLSGKNLCNACNDKQKEKNKQRLKERRELLQKLHLCVDCKQKDGRTMRGYSRCYTCFTESQLKRTGKIYNRETRVGTGLCTVCEKPVKKGYRVCEEHYQRMVELSKKSHANHGEGRHTDYASNPKMPRKEWAENGFCYLCGDVAEKGYKVCEKCHKRLIDIRQKQKENGQDRLIREQIENLFRSFKK